MSTFHDLLTDDLRRKPWKGMRDPLAGHCYVAAEAMYHVLGGKDAGWKAKYLRHEGWPHWYLEHQDGTILDPTAEQFDTPVPYEQGRGIGFLTEWPSKRAKILIERLQNME